MGMYQGDEQNNPILKFIRNIYHGSPLNQSLELPNLQNAYRLWNAAKLGGVPFLTSSEAQVWFGHSLFTANIKIYMGYSLLGDISYLFSYNNPQRPVIPSPQSATYEAPNVPYSEPEKQLKRFSSYSTFLWHLLGALDVMTVGLAFLYGFEQKRTIFCSSSKKRGRIDPLKVGFSDGILLLQAVDSAGPIPGQAKPQNLIAVFEKEGLLTYNSTSNKTGCNWYDDLRTQRNYHTHKGFPVLYMVNGKWHVPIDVQSTTPMANLTEVSLFCDDLFENVHRFIGKVYGCAWADFSQYLHLP